jgi:hypothetical protein
VAIANPLDVDFSKDRKIGARASLLQPRKFLALVVGRIARDVHGRTDIPRTSHVQEGLEHPPPDYQEFPENGFLDLMNRLTLIGGVLEVLDQCPKRIEAFVDASRASLLLGSRRERELDGSSPGSEHEFGSSRLWNLRDLFTSGKIPHQGSPFEAYFSEVEILRY